MHCGPIRHWVNAKVHAIARPFEHTVIVRPTGFLSTTAESDQHVAFQSPYRELIEDGTRNRLICDDLINALRNRRSPLVLTQRNDHLDRLASQLSGSIRHLLVFRGGMGRKQRRRLPISSRRFHRMRNASSCRPASTWAKGSTTRAWTR
jgi:hypothetical protein